MRRVWGFMLSLWWRLVPQLSATREIKRKKIAFSEAYKIGDFNSCIILNAPIQYIWFWLALYGFGLEAVHDIYSKSIQCCTHLAYSTVRIKSPLFQWKQFMCVFQRRGGADACWGCCQWTGIRNYASKIVWEKLTTLQFVRTARWGQWCCLLLKLLCQTSCWTVKDFHT